MYMGNLDFYLFFGQIRLKSLLFGSLVLIFENIQTSFSFTDFQSQKKVPSEVPTFPSLCFLLYSKNHTTFEKDNGKR